MLFNNECIFLPYVFNTMAPSVVQFCFFCPVMCFFFTYFLGKVYVRSSCQAVKERKENKKAEVLESILLRITETDYMLCSIELAEMQSQLAVKTVESNYREINIGGTGSLLWVPHIYMYTCVCVQFYRYIFICLFTLHLQPVVSLPMARRWNRMVIKVSSSKNIL